MEQRTKLEALDVLKEIKSKVGFYSVFQLVERINIKDIEYEESKKQMLKISDRLNDLD